MGNSASVIEEMHKVCEYAGKPGQETELSKALEALSSRIKSNPSKTINLINNDGGSRNWSAFSNIISSRSEPNEKNVILAMELIEVMLSNPDNKAEVAGRIIGESSIRDISKSSLLSILLEQISNKKSSVRFAALRIIDRLTFDPRFIEKQIEGGIIEPYLWVLDMEISMDQDDVLNVSFPAKNICLKVLQEIIEGEESYDLKDKCKRGRVIEICCKVIYQAREQRQKIQPITEILALKLLATLCAYQPCREEMESSGEFDEVAMLFPMLTNNESKIHLLRFLVYMAENASILKKFRESEKSEKIIEFIMAELSKASEPSYKAFLCILVIALSPDAGNTETLKQLTIQCTDLTLLKYLVSLFTKISVQATKHKESHEFFQYLFDPIASILKLPNFKEIVGCYDILYALEHLSLSTICYDFWTNRASIDTIIERALDVLKKKVTEPEDVVMLNKLVKIVANMYLSRGPKTPPCEDKVIELMLKCQNFRLGEEEGDAETEVIIGRFPYKLTTEAVEVRQDAKLVLASVTNMQIQSKDAHALYKMIFKMMGVIDVNTQFRALCCLAHLALDQQRRFVLLQSNIIRRLIEMLSLERDEETYPFIVRESAKILTNISKSPDGMVLWLKFNSSKLSIDSSLNYNLLTLGKPEKLKQNHETIFGVWGARFNQGDVLEIPGHGIHLEEYTFCCWVYLPYSSNELNYFHTLAQEEEGVGGLIVIDQNFTCIGTFDEESGQLIESPISLQKIINQARKWHHIAVTVENNTDQSVWGKKAHKITYFFDGVQQGDPIPINAPTSIKYLGNSKDRKESFGRIADIRIYPYILKDSNITEIYHILQTYEEDDNFDNIGGAFSKCGIDPIPLILNSLKCNVPDMQVELCKLIAAMCTTRVSRMEFVRRQTFDVLLANSISLQENVRVESSRAMMYLI